MELNFAFLCPLFSIILHRFYVIFIYVQKLNFKDDNKLDKITYVFPKMSFQCI